LSRLRDAILSKNSFKKCPQSLFFEKGLEVKDFLVVASGGKKMIIKAGYSSIPGSGQL